MSENCQYVFRKIKSFSYQLHVKVFMPVSFQWETVRNNFCLLIEREEKNVSQFLSILLAIH